MNDLIYASFSDATKFTTKNLGSDDFPALYHTVKQQHQRETCCRYNHENVSRDFTLTGGEESFTLLKDQVLTIWWITSIRNCNGWNEEKYAIFRVLYALSITSIAVAATEGSQFWLSDYLLFPMKVWAKPVSNSRHKKFPCELYARLALTLHLTYKGIFCQVISIQVWRILYWRGPLLMDAGALLHPLGTASQ